MVALRHWTVALGALLPAIIAAPTSNAPETKREVIPGKYIITLKSDATASDIDSHLSWVSDVHRRSLHKRQTAGIENTYNISSWNAYAGEFDDETIEKIKENPEVSIVITHQETFSNASQSFRWRKSKRIR